MTPEVLREFRRKQAEAELQFDSAQDETDHGVVARPVVEEKVLDDNDDCGEAARKEGDARAGNTPPPIKRKYACGAWIIPFSMGIVAAMVAQLVVSTFL